MEVTQATAKADLGIEAGTKVILPLNTFPKWCWWFFSETTSKPDKFIKLELVKKYF